MQDVVPDDAATYDMICRADTVGVFQIESRAQMSMLPRLRPREFYDLVVQVAIVRPGPIQGGMVHPYLRNRALPDDAVPCPPELRPALMRTKGVPIFQEQVMQIAMLAADFTAGEADALRRAMAAWKRKGGLGPFRDRLVGRMVEKGYTRDYAERIFKQIEGFGEYGFPESHAVSFALLAYASSWVKRHHPDAFLAGLLDSQPMGFYAPSQLVRDARAHGVAVRPVDVLHSEWGSRLEGEAGALRAVRLGFDRIVGLREEAARRIVCSRDAEGFASVEDLARRAALDARDLQLLAQAGALAALSGHRHQAAWVVCGIDAQPTAMLRDTRVHETPVALAAPHEADDMLADYRSLGLTLNRHPLALLRERLAAWRVQPAAVLRDYPDGRPARASGLVTHRQRPGDVYKRQGQGHGLRHAGRRDRHGQRHRLAAHRRAAARAAACIDAAHGVRHLAARRRRDAPRRREAGRSLGAARRTAQPQPRLPLNMRVSGLRSLPRSALWRQPCLGRPRRAAAVPPARASARARVRRAARPPRRRAAHA